MPFHTSLVLLFTYLVIHLRRNIKQQLHNQHFPEEHVRTTLEEIFGAQKGTVHLEGLIDAKSSEEFDSKLTALKPLWDARESADSACQPGFYNWLVKHKVDLLKSSVLCPVRDWEILQSCLQQMRVNRSMQL